MTTSQLIYQVDAFTARPFAGNPAAVLLLPGAREPGWMQQVAREMNLSETAFLAPHADDGFDLRWFTPLAEVELCGHATLASAHVLWETGALAPDAPAQFHTQSGLLSARRAGEWIELDFPARPARAADCGAELARALGAEPIFCSRTRYDLMVELSSERELRSLQPDFGQLTEIDARGVMVTARAAAETFDFVSRFFAPRVGIDEDPVTGSAHCTLGPYWAEALGKNPLRAHQASERGGELIVRVEGDRVFLQGQAVTVMRAELLVA
jgi:PhzF family phenazine biosynthesis protein